MPSNSSPSEDAISSSDIKDCKYSIARLFALILNRSLIEHKPLECPFISKLCTVAKPNKKKYDAASYRPISLTFQIVKLMLHVIAKSIKNHLELVQLSVIAVL